MRTLIYRRTGPARDVLEVTERPVPEPGPGEVRVRIHASGINPHDVKRRAGWTEADPSPEGYVPHSDGAGVIEAAGAGVPAQRIGQRVYLLRTPEGDGTAAEHAVIGADWALPLPDTLSFAQGASLGVPAFTAWLAVLSDGPVTGQTVLIHGGGGAVGRVCVALAAWNGARVVATAGSAHGRAVAAAKGADMVIDRHADDPVATVMALSGGRGAARIIDVDFAANRAADAEALAEHGTVAAYSSTSGRMPVLDYYAFARKGATLRFVQANRLTPGQRDAAADVIAALLARGHLVPDVAAPFSLEQAAAAHEAVEAGAPANVVLALA